MFDAKCAGACLHRLAWKQVSCRTEACRTAPSTQQVSSICRISPQYLNTESICLQIPRFMFVMVEIVLYK